MKLYVEVTHTEGSDMNTGIPRVVRNILKNLLEIGPSRGISVLPIIFQRGSLVVVSPERVLKNKATGQDHANNLWGRWNRFACKGLVRFRRLLELFGVRLLVARLVESEPRERHVLLLLDASWGYDIWPEIEALKARGLLVVSVIYDLIPITHSHTVVEPLVRAFEPWLLAQMRFCDSVVCISRSIASAIQAYFQQGMVSLGIARTIPVSSFCLGSDLDFADGRIVVQRKLLRLKSAASPIFLMVGTIEPRKNHRDVFNAFKKLWAQGVDARLVIVGARDWMSEDLLWEIARHPETEKRLFLIRDASDADLHWLYVNANALVMASEVEGFGLPIAEAGRLGLQVICSDIPVFSEFAGTGTEFFRVGDVDDLARVIAARVALPSAPVEGRGGWITWRESAQQLLGSIERSVLSANP
jgi:glycosyltransferase involved in cell wall biosynthesis